MSGNAGCVGRRIALGLVAALACSLAGCGVLMRSVARTGHVLSSVGLPLSVPVSEVNYRLDARSRDALATIEAELDLVHDRQKAVRHYPLLADERGRGGDFLEKTLEPLRRQLRIYQSPPDEFDDFADLAEGQRHTVVIVCISGGGARAASLARHVMSLLEQAYNDVSPAGAKPLIDSIDAYSTVSGGSIYASHVAVRHLREPDRKAAGKQPRGATTFQELAAERWATAHLGCKASIAYLSPFNLFLYPVANLVTDWDYLDLLAYTLKNSHGGGFLPVWAGFRMGQLERAPRFYFNATCLESGTPFILTQRLVHLPSERPPRPTARLTELLEEEKHGGNVCLPSPTIPLGHALTLENFNSSPGRFPLAYAAMASAAFPIGTDPLPIRTYRFVAATPRDENGRLPRSAVGRTGTVLYLADGGVYDNSGLHTAVALLEHLVAPRNHEVKRVVLLQISAEVDEYDPGVAGAIQDAFSYFGLLKPKLTFPIKELLGGARSLALLHYINKRRAEELAIRRLQRLKDANRIDDYVYFPVSLAQLSPNDPCAVQHKPGVFERIRRIPTDFTISPEDDTRLAEAAQMLLSTSQKAPQRPGAGDPQAKSGWEVGPNCNPIDRIDLAFAYAVVRAHLPQWYEKDKEPQWRRPFPSTGGEGAR